MSNTGPTYWTYILRCSDSSLYVGFTRDLRGRVKMHNNGQGPDYTAARLPVSVVYSEQHRCLEDALQRERQLKRWSHAKKEALIAGDFALLNRLTRPGASRPP